METTLAIVVLIVILALLGTLIYAYVRASGPGALRAWFVAPASVRQTFGALIATGDASSTRPDRQSAIDATESTALATGRERELAVVDREETLLATMREHVEQQLAESRQYQEHIEGRLARLDGTVGELQRIPDQVAETMQRRERDGSRALELIRHELEGVRRGATAAGARRDEAYADLYGHVARLEASLSTVINPMQLPGEPLQIPDEFVPDTLEWDNWDDIGEHAYAFGVAFNQSRLVLDPELSHQIEQFIGTLRLALTGKVYPTVRRAEPTRAQLATMRSGLEAIVSSLTPIRRQLETSWYLMDRPSQPSQDKDDFGGHKEATGGDQH
jgi:hypothetical protein